MELEGASGLRLGEPAGFSWIWRGWGPVGSPALSPRFREHDSWRSRGEGKVFCVSGRFRSGFRREKGTMADKPVYTTDIPVY